MEYIFYAKTSEGYCFKVLSELLQHSVKTSYYELDQSGIHLKMSDSNQNMTFIVDLFSENFFNYSLSVPKLCFSVNHMHMHTMLKTIKKKDTVSLFIEKARPEEICIKIEPREKTKVTCSYIKIHSAHTIPILVQQVSKYAYTIPVSSSDYSKTCKELSKLSKTITISCTETGIKFGIFTSNVYSKEILIGDPFIVGHVSQDFVSEHLGNIAKISGISQCVHMSQDHNLPLLLKSNVGTLGKIIIYMHSRNTMSIKEGEGEHILEI